MSGSARLPVPLPHPSHYLRACHSIFAFSPSRCFRLFAAAPSRGLSQLVGPPLSLRGRLSSSFGGIGARVFVRTLSISYVSDTFQLERCESSG